MPAKRTAPTARPRAAATGAGPQAPLPASYEPQLATLVKEAPTGDAWLHELKYDGYRIGCRIDGKDVRLVSRRGKDWTAAFPEVCAAARRLPARRALLDGEVAVVLPDGKTSFQALQNAFGGQGRKGLTYFVFDLLHLDGRDLSILPLEERKRALEGLIRPALEGPRAAPPAAGEAAIRYSEHVAGSGRDFLAHACKLGLEGIVSKQRALPYHGGRTTSWLKSKCTKRQELVIGGFTDPEGARSGIGALLVGVHDAAGRLAFAGKVGTGFSQKNARDLRSKLEALEQKTPPFDPPPTGWLKGNAHWVRPSLVAEVNFAEWTGDGKVRHASFQGLRTDKPAREVVAEKPVDPPPAPEDAPPAPRPRASTVTRVKMMTKAKETKTTTAKAAKATKPTKAATKAGGKDESEVAGIRISHPERVLYPGTSFTKLDLARYYEAIGKWALPHMAGRPLSLVRCPKGLTGDEKQGCFYMKHSDLWAPPALKRVQIREQKKLGQYLVIEDLAGIVSLVQMNVLEIHTWNSPADDVEHPTRVVFDLDPGPEVPWTAVIEAARLVRDVLGSLELESHVKTTGGRGLHVVVPFLPERTWDESLGFSEGLSAAIAARNPDRYTVSIPKAGREKKILIDYLRNARSQTSIAAYSTRARAGATVSVPLAWEELDARLTSGHFTMATVPGRLQKLKKDPWEKYWKSQQRLTPAILEAVAKL